LGFSTGRIILKYDFDITPFSLKKLINRPGDEVKEMMEGMVLAYPNIVRRVPGWNTLVRADVPLRGKVSVVSGGGSGHEPAHGAYVGKGMLAAACAGEVFTSPSVGQIAAAVKEVDSGSGTLMVIKNYSGDVMNFGAVSEMVEASGGRIDSVVVNDDVALDDPAIRRGIAGTVFVHKCAGAKAETGASLPEVKAVAEKVIGNVRSMGCALTSCIVPSVGSPTFQLGPDEMEFGIGIHGERGTKRDRVRTADEVARVLTEACVKDLGLKRGEEVAVMVQGYGGTPSMERFILYRAVNRIIQEAGGRVVASWVGEFMTSLEMAGASVSVLRLDSELKSLMGAPCETIAVRQC
jgi:phosphoenolpyruvate---glycerone phosphotransferase subunit DhaK